MSSIFKAAYAIETLTELEEKKFVQFFVKYITSDLI